MNARIYRLAAFCAALAVLSLVIPRFVPASEGGFAAAGTAVLIFLGTLAAAFVLSLYLLFVTVSQYRQLSTGARAAGLAPAVALGLALFGLIGWLRY